VDHGRLQAGLDPALLQSRSRLRVELAREQRLDCAKQRHADERDDLRPVSADLLFQNGPTLGVFHWREIVDPGTRTRDQVRDAESELRQPRIVPTSDGLRHQPRFPQKLPEPVGEPGEVMAGLSRPHTGVDPDEQHAYAGLDPVLQPKVGPIHETIQP
jgi:hypothetical protein